MFIKILGSGSATPYLERHQSSVLLSHQSNLFLFDCGEGIQMQLLRYEVKFAKINHIFITHLHGDHYLGLIGLLSSIHSWGRKSDLYLYAPAGLKEILSIQFKYQETRLNYRIILKEIETTKNYILFEDESLSIQTVPLNHRIPCAGFVIKEKQKLLNLDKNKLPKNILLQEIHQLKQGKDIVDPLGNIKYKASELTLPPEPTRSFAYITDTIFDMGIVPLISNVNLLYHESTFLNDKIERAATTHHSTANQAATIAKAANVQKLVIGHFSSRYKNLNPFLEEAKETFENTYLALEGVDFTI